MMGIYIKGMVMPYDCDSCKVSDILDCTLWKPMDIGERHPECPLVEVPTPHGDLIDRDEVRDSVFNHLSIKGEENLLPAEKSVFGNIIKAKAVIEAEDGT